MICEGCQCEFESESGYAFCDQCDIEMLNQFWYGNSEPDDDDTDHPTDQPQD